MLHSIVGRILKILTRRGALVEEQDSMYVADDDGDADDARALRPLHAAACTYRIAFGPRAGQKLLTVQGAMPREPGFEQDLRADTQGFSLQAAVRCEADDRQGLERPCRCITRPALAYDGGAMRRRRAGGAEAEDAVARRHHAPGDLAAGVHATAGGAGTAPVPANLSRSHEARTSDCSAAVNSGQ